MSENRSLFVAIPNYTEDDTFRILSRPSIQEMVRLYNDTRDDKNRKTYNLEFVTMLNIKFINEHNWDWIEFLIAAQKANLSIF